MSLEYAILGFLNTKALSGYDLKKVFDQSVAHFWYADQSQIYRTLKRLKEKGWIVAEVIHQEEGVDKKLYSITEKGREEFFRWMENLQLSERNRNAQLIQVYFSDTVPDEQVIRLFEQKRAEINEVLSIYENIARTYPIEEEKDPKTQRFQFYKYLTLECGIASLKAEQAWVDSVIERIKEKKYNLKFNT